MSVADRTWAEPVAGPGGDPQLGCDLPLDLGPIHAHNELLVGGWAVAGAGRIAAVEVEVGGWTLLAAFGLPSPFLAPAFDNAEHNRYEVRVDTSSLARGEHELLVRARTSEGAVAEMAGTLVVEPFRTVPWRLEDQRAAVAADEPAMWCESPNIFVAEDVTLPTTLRGWAHHPSGIAAVAAFVDGVRIDGVGGLPRDDLRARVGARVSAAGGFRIRLARDDVSPGRHDVAVLAFPIDGEPIGVAGVIVAGAGGWTPQAVVEEEDLVAERYVPDRHRGISFEIEHQARYRWAASLVPGKEVLDAGCGTGWGTALLAEGGAARVVGVDRSALAIDHGRAEHGDAVEVRVADICAPDLPDASFDVVVCFEAIEHVDDPSSALDHFRRVLRPDGVLVVSTPVKGVYPAGNPFHVHEFEAGELEAALRRRFAHVAAHRQRTQAASLLADDATTASFDPDRRLDLDVRKLEGVPPGKETFTVVVASDAALPPAPRIAVMGEALDLQALNEQLTEALSQIDEVEARAEFAQMHLELALHMQDMAAERAHTAERDLALARESLAELDAVVGSRSWRWSAPLRTAAARVRSQAAQRKKP
jgi:SAM-dependent methyltransferase